MRHNPVVFIVLICCSNILWSQVPFANTFQVPLLLNPSFAGNKNMRRCVAAYNQNESSDYRNRSYHASYDNFAKNKGFAYGVYALMTEQSRIYQGGGYNYQRDYFDHGILKQVMPIKNINKELGVVLAMKNNFEDKEGKGGHKATLSPSIGFGISNEQSEYISGFGKTTKPLSDTLSSTKDSLYYNHQLARELHVNMQFGVKYNNQNFTAMYYFGYSLGHVLERHYRWRTVSYTTFGIDRTGKTLSEPNYYNHKFEHRLTVGYTIPRKPNTKSSATFMASVGMVKYTVSSAKAHSNSDNFKDKQSIPRFAHANVSALFRYGKVLGSLAFTQYTFYTTYGIGIGLQREKYRVIVSCFPKAKNYNSSLEVVLALFW